VRDNLHYLRRSHKFRSSGFGYRNRHHWTAK
jgi:hypothetical protein